MRSIGAAALSELAKNLEMAGKKDDISYILKHHEEMMEEYKEMFEKLKSSGVFGKDSKIEVKREKVKQEEKTKEDSKEKQEELWELDDEDFDSILEKLEESIYELNSKHMMEITEELKVCSYQGKALKEIMVMAQRKIEMSDYISAVDMIANWKEKNRR